MIPRVYERTNGLIKIMFVCISCGHNHINKAAQDDDLGEIDMWIEFRYQRYAHKIRHATRERKKSHHR